MTQPTNPDSVLNVALLPSLITPESMAGNVVVVVDVLRATTTILHALKNGAEKVLPQPSIESARSTHATEVAAGSEAILGGERGGKIVDGFHNGNSPLEYTADVIGGKTLVLATTNGTVAMEQCRFAKQVLIGAMVNLEALASLIVDEPLITVVCSGTDKSITGEDVIFAGALLDLIIKKRTAAEKPVGQLTDMASIALNHWHGTQSLIDSNHLTRRMLPACETLADFFRNARGGINLVKIGHDADIVFASEIDKVPVVAELDIASWSIKLI